VHRKYAQKAKAKVTTQRISERNALEKGEHLEKTESINIIRQTSLLDTN